MSRAMDRFCADLRITYRQWDYWCRRGWVYEADRDNPGQRTCSPHALPGTGQQRRLNSVETAHLRRMADLVNDGMTPARAAQLAWAPGSGELALAWAAGRGECA